MNVPVEVVRTSAFVLSDDNEFVCLHEFADVEAPCCNGSDCACHGLYAVKCDDCKILSEKDIDKILAEEWV